MRRTIVFLGLLAAGASHGFAQTSIPAGSPDLTLPPALRGQQPVQAPKPAARKAKRAAAGRPVGPPGTAAGADTNDTRRSDALSSDHPIAFGVQVHGGGGDPQHYSATGLEAPGEETGNGVAAGFKLGF